MRPCPSAALAVVLLAAALPARGSDEEEKKKVLALAKVVETGAQADRIKAAAALGKMGAAARPAARSLARLATDPAEKLSLAGHDALRQVWPEVAEAGIVLMTDKEEQFNTSKKRVKAIETLVKVGAESDAGVPFLLHHLRARMVTEADFFQLNDALVANVAALKKLAPDDPAFHRALVAAAGGKDTKGRNRLLAMAALGELVGDRPKLRKEMLPLYRQWLAMTPASPAGKLVPREMAESVREAAAAGLGKCGRDAKDDLPALKKARLTDESEKVRAAAEKAIRAIEEDAEKK